MAPRAAPKGTTTAPISLPLYSFPRFVSMSLIVLGTEVESLLNEILSLLSSLGCGPRGRTSLSKYRLHLLSRIVYDQCFSLK
jgi:hypothetical protein